MKKFIVLFTILTFASLTFSQGDWEIIQEPTQPLLSSTTIDNMFFLTPNEGWLVGGVGTAALRLILHTANAGQSWEVLYSLPAGSDTVFNGVYFLDSNTGWVVGDDGLIWKSDDGGVNWTDQTHSDTIPNLQSISPVNSDLLYVSGDDGTILKSINGGADWTYQILGDSTSDLDGIHAFNADTVFAFSNTNDGYIFSTTDGGANWNRINAPFPGPGSSLRQYDCIGLPNGTAYISGYHGTVFKSTDYGVSWTNVANIFGPLFKLFYSIGASGNNVWAGDSNGNIYFSGNAGATWDTLAFHTTNNIKYIKAFNDNQVYVYGDYAQLFESTDAGQTFTPLIPWPNLSWWDMVATSNKMYVASITGGEITVSEDGGESWSHPLTPVTGQYGNINDLFFLDDNLGFFSGQDGMVGKTTDGGETWALKPTHYGFATNKYYDFIYFKDASNGFTGGSSGIIEYSTDGGETWTEGSSGGTSRLYDCYFIDPDTGIISAASGKILRSTDGGTNWTEVVDFGSMAMRNIYFLDDTTGFICASSGYLYKTTDAGASWTEVVQLSNVNSPGDDPDLYRITFVNDTTGYICGEDGALYKSTDVGANWTQQTVPPEAVGITLQAMAWVDETTGYLAGQNGYIFGTIPQVVPSPLVINEVMWDVTRDVSGTPNVNEGDANGDGVRSPRGDEFIELVNTGTTPLDISGYQLLRRNGYLIFTFPNNIILDPVEFTVVFGGVGPSGFGSQFPPELKIFASKPGEADSGFADLTSTNMLSAGDNVVVVNPALNDTIAEIYWGTSSPVSSKAIKTEPPNTVGDKVIEGAVAQAVTRNPDLTGLWDLHTEATNNIYHSPGTYKDNPYVGIESDNGYGNKPTTFALYQNYPNPFNPETSIKFDLPVSEKISITIYNTLGQVVRTLYQGNMSAGSHRIIWNSRNDHGLPSPSGIYFYKLKAGDFTSMKKMILIR